VSVISIFIGSSKVLVPSFFMKFVRNTLVDPSAYWNGIKPLPDEINVISFHPQMAEFELLSILCTLQGYLTAFDLLAGAVADTEKDRDIQSVMTAFHSYLYPKMPLSNYTETDCRSKPSSGKRSAPIDPS